MKNDFGFISETKQKFRPTNISIVLLWRALCIMEFN